MQSKSTLILVAAIKALLSSKVVHAQLFAPTDPSKVATSVPTGYLEFFGPGIVSCPVDDYLLAACVPEFFVELDECDNVQACTQVLDGNTTDVDIVLPCDCMKASGCAQSCTFTPTSEAVVPDTSNDFTGPGYISCPYGEYEAFPCFAVQSSDTCANLTACVAGSVPTLDMTFENALIPLPCECVAAYNCHSSCVFMEGEAPTLPQVLGTANFTGPGLVTCPLWAIAQQECLPAGSFFDFSDSSCTEDCSSYGNYDDDGFGDETIQIPLYCSCMSLLECADACTFSALNETRPPMSGSNTSPVHVPLFPVAAPASVASTLDVTTSPTLDPSAMGSVASVAPTTAPPIEALAPVAMTSTTQSPALPVAPTSPMVVAPLAPGSVPTSMLRSSPTAPTVTEASSAMPVRNPWLTSILLGFWILVPYL